MTKAIVVLTAKSVATILEEGGSSAWRLDRNNARQCSYAICTRNAHADWTEGKEPHHSAFLVGRISEVVEAPNHKGRYLIQFDGYALVDIPNAWKGDRNPVKYEELEAFGIDASALKWEDMSAPPVDASTAHPVVPVVQPITTGVTPLTIAQAKSGLALTFGVEIDAIEITIRG